jgi:hypothetical protein
LAVIVLAGGCDDAPPPASADTEDATTTGVVEDGESTGGESGEESTGEAEVICDPPLTKCGQTCVDLQSDPNNCAVCGLSCVVPNGVGACIDGACGMAECDYGWADCDGAASSGCETLDECEDAGACATECGSTGSLDCGDPCAPVCLIPAESCNLADDDCDGACDEDAVEGCRVGIHVGQHPTAGQVLMTDEAEADLYGVQIEQMNAFYLYAEAGGGNQPLHRCESGGGTLGYSPDNDCEGFGAIDTTLGFFAPQAAACGAVPLYRLSLPPATMMTTSQAEVDEAVAEGWTLDSFRGFAWPAP